MGQMTTKELFAHDVAKLTKQYGAEQVARVMQAISGIETLDKMYAEGRSDEEISTTISHTKRQLGLLFQQETAMAHLTASANDNPRVLKLDARIPGDSKAPDAEEQVKVEDDITTDPYEKLRRSITLIREHAKAAAQPEGMDDLVDAFVDVVAVFLMNGQAQVTQLEGIANAVVAQTKLLCHAYSGTVSEKAIGEAVSGLKE